MRGARGHTAGVTYKFGVSLQEPTLVAVTKRPGVTSHLLNMKAPLTHSLTHSLRKYSYSQCPSSITFTWRLVTKKTSGMNWSKPNTAKQSGVQRHQR